MGALTQGALAECFKRFPWVAKIVLKLFPSKIEELIKDTQLNERMSIDLISK